ncbi:hypothetical protein Syun_006161 [Stephania yunnanensis]|uniref:Uncharacterized protein n=1 Tax=Stephania yunnanensis TaxID=152371 RepID=A0AAP0PYA9_9MAGN
MGNQRCANGELDTSNYSSPMPAIGLYIVGSTLVCLLLILLDIYAGFRNRKRWLPCRFFSLNSVTLTLFGVATKLPVDLTTSMPSAQDQLSKLTGTTFICISMGFLMPSIGVTTQSECLSNMFCNGVSDYGWSMWGIIVSQTITILVGCLGISIRCLSMANHLAIHYGDDFRCICCYDASWLENAFVKVIFPQFDIIFDFIGLFLEATKALVEFTKRLMQAQKSYGRARFNKPEDKFEDEAMTIECEKLLEEKSEFGIDNWTLKKGVKELMKKLIEKKRLKAIVELLNRPPFSQESLTAFLATLKEYEVNPISVVVFARITTISIPTSLSQCIQDSFEEVFEIIEYIARKTITEVGFYEIDDLRGWWSE